MTKTIYVDNNLFFFKEKLIDMKNERGLMYRKICYTKYKKPATKKGRLGRNGDDNNCNNNNNDDEIDELEFLLFFKSCIVDRDREILKIKLKQSIEMREALVRKKDTQFHKVFPFYFIDPTLILFDFEIRFKSCDSKVLFDVWPGMRVGILKCIPTAARDGYLKMFNEDIGYYLALLKVSCARSANHAENTKKLFVYSDVSSALLF